MKNELVIFMGFLISFVFWFAIYIHFRASGSYAWVVAFYGLVITWTVLILAADEVYRRREATKVKF
jgi:hypothetical protein